MNVISYSFLFNIYNMKYVKCMAVYIISLFQLQIKSVHDQTGLKYKLTAIGTITNCHLVSPSCIFNSFWFTLIKLYKENFNYIFIDDKLTHSIFLPLLFYLLNIITLLHLFGYLWHVSTKKEDLTQSQIFSSLLCFLCLMAYQSSWVI